MSLKYGTEEWLEAKFRLVEDDPWGHGWRSVELCRYDYVIRLIESCAVRSRDSGKRLRLLDVGCSTGYFTNRLSALGGDVLGIDLSETAIQRARNRFQGISYKTGSVFDGDLPPESFDVATCLEVIYYVPESEQARFLARIRQLLVDNGILVVSSRDGPPPYFSEKRLIELLAQHFAVKCVTRYGWTKWARCEGYMFAFWQKAQKLNKLLKADQHESEEKLLGEVLMNEEKRAQARKLLHLLGRYPTFHKLVGRLAQISAKVIELCLGWRIPASVASKLAVHLRLKPTHTIIIVAKQSACVE